MSSFDTSAPNIKLVILGQTMVGKTSLVNVIHGGKFIPEQTATVGACFQIKNVVVDGQSINIHLWDTAGQERFRALTPMYYRDAQIALLVYSVANRDSFTEIREWHRGLVQDCPIMPKVVLVANKSDLADKEGTVPESEGRKLAEEIDATFFQVSARCDEDGVRKMFDKISEMAASLVIGQATERETAPQETTEHTKSCC